MRGNVLDEMLRRAIVRDKRAVYIVRFDQFGVEARIELRRIPGQKFL